MIALFAALALQTAAPAACALTEADRIANRSLSFSQFDQGLQELPQAGWALSQRGCYAEAIAAEQDFLVFGPKLERRETLSVTWHMVLNLANLGHEDEAARLAASTINDAAPPQDGMDWNTYVRGVWGFLNKDRTLLDRSLASLTAAEGRRNGINAGQLRRLSTCFNRPYAEAARNPACAAD